MYLARLQKILANKDSLNQHVLRHQDLKLKCDQCPPDERTFPTMMSLKQHKQGKHGNGFIALCGYVCKWPDERCEHQKECRECSVEKDKKLNKDENPWKPKKRNKIFKNRGVSKKPKKETENKNDVNMDSKDSDTHIKSNNEDSETPEKLKVTIKMVQMQVIQKRIQRTLTPTTKVKIKTLKIKIMKHHKQVIRKAQMSKNFLISNSYWT